MADCYITLSNLKSHDRRSLLRALDSYRLYAQNASQNFIQPRKARFKQLRHAKQDVLAQDLAYDKTLRSIEGAIDANAEIASAIYRQGCAVFSKFVPEVDTPELWHGSASDFDCVVARSCIRAMFRDWSTEGKAERRAAHDPILESLDQTLRSKSCSRTRKVLVPGVGLGRLVHAIAERGYSVEGNDVSYQTLLARIYLFGDYVCRASMTLHPWALSFSNHISRRDQLRKVMIPDYCPSNTIRLTHRDVPSLPQGPRQVVFTTGDFVRMYGASDRAQNFSALATCYFIDTAPDFLDYIDTAWNCLEEGGVWINIGPLLWNAEENGPAGNEEGDLDEQEAWQMRDQQRSGNTNSLIELTDEEVRVLLERKGFVIERQTSDLGSSSYVGNKASMLQYTYNMAFWVARKESVCDRNGDGMEQESMNGIHHSSDMGMTEDVDHDHGLDTAAFVSMTDGSRSNGEGTDQRMSALIGTNDINGSDGTNGASGHGRPTCPKISDSQTE